MYRIVGLTTMLLVAVVLLSACSGGSGLTGKYISDRSSDRYRELDSDGTFYSQEGSIGFSGEYKVDGDVITYFLEFGISVRGRIVDGVLVDGDGERWSK